MRKKFFTRLLAITLCAGLIFQPVTAYASQPAEGEISEAVIINETMEEIGEAPETVEFDEDIAEINEVPDTVEFDEDIAETNDVRIPIPGVDKLPAITGVRIEGDLFSWDPVPGADTYWLEVGDKRDFYLEEGMPYNIYDSFHDTFKLDYGTYTVMFYAVNWDSYRCSEVYQFEYNFAPKKTPIYNATITTDAKQIAIDGNANRNVHITGTNRPEISIDVGIWQKYRNDGSAYSDWKTFTPGTYCYEVTAYLNLDYIDKFEVRDNFQLTIDGVTCDYYRKIYNSGRYLYFFTSPTYEVKEIPKINNLRIDGDLLYWDSVKNASSYLLEIGVHQYLLTDEDMPYNIKEAFSKTELISGDYTIYFVALDQNNERFTKLYELDYTYNNRTLVDSISVSTDAKDLLKDGNARTKAKITNEENPEVTVNFYKWRKVSEDGTEKDFYDKTFTPGKYRFELAVYLNASYVDKYELDENTQLVIDGVAVKSHNQINSYGKYIMYFYSPYFEIEVQPEPVSGRWFVKYGATYYELSTGELATGVLVIDGDYYLFNKRGVRQTATFYEDDGKTYYFGKDGKRITGWMTKWSSTCYFDEDGVMQTGFTDIDGDTYYFKADGRQVHTAWITIADKKYYAKSDGKIAKSETITKWGKKYSFDADGVLISK